MEKSPKAVALKYDGEKNSAPRIIAKGKGDIAKKIIQLTNSSSKIEYAPPRAGDVKHSQASIDKITQAGFTPSSDFDLGLEKTIEYFSQKSGG